MPKLRCSANGCMYNQGSLCARNRIHVQGCEACMEDETQCGTFRVSQGEKPVLFRTEFAKFEEANEHLSINCDAHLCKHNDNYLCTKDNVKISGSNAKNRQETVCESFEKKI